MSVLSSFNCSPSKMFILLRFAILAIVLVLVSRADSLESTNQAIMNLSQFRYLSPTVRNPQSEHIMSRSVLTNSIQEFQAFTGEVDRETNKLMKTPRCGVKDKVGFATSSRSKRYTVQGSRWRVKNLTYKISKYPSNFNKADTDKVLKDAFGVWASVTPLTFTQKETGLVHIEIWFERGEHGDGDQFDGPGGIFAHALYPVYGGDVYFDDAEKWTINSYRGTNLFQVAVHQFGHSLGLSHSDVLSAAMAPFYRGYEPTFKLHSDDVKAIQALYGEKGSDNKDSGFGNKIANDASDEEGEDGELCNDATIDTIFKSAEDDTYVFKGLHYWKLTDIGIAKGYPRLISESWIGLPGNMDAAFTYRNGKTYFFKGSKYWRYTGKVMDGNYPKEISLGFSGIPNNIDAATVWGGNRKIYFYKGSKFWGFDPTQKPPVNSTYPKPISNWGGIPNDIDAALQDDKSYTYIFKGGSYWRFNNKAFTVDNLEPPFPRPAGKWWFGCQAQAKGSNTGGNKTATDKDSELCNNATIDTIFNSAEGVTYVFKGLHFWKLTEKSIEKGYPRLISEYWIGLPGNMDAAFTYKNGKTYFFKGSKYWRYTGKVMDGDYPKEISLGFSGIPNNIDAATVWSGNQKIYFFKGSKFWKLDPTQKHPTNSTYPKLISNWKGIPNDIDAAFNYVNGYTYFFKGGSYWRFNDRAFTVDIGDPPFPRPASHWWFGCQAEAKVSNTSTVDTSSAHLEQDEAIHTVNSDSEVDDMMLDGVLDETSE